MSNIANTVYMAIVQHNKWKHQLKEIVETGQVGEEYDPDPSHCSFGQWMEENADALKAFDKYQQVNELHKQFHDEAGRIVMLALKGEREQAQTSMEYGNEFDHLSQALVKAIIEWHDEIMGK